MNGNGHRRLRAIILIVLGIVGLGQYGYFQSSPLAYVIDGVVRENVGGYPVVVEIISHRDWTVGIVGAIVGLMLVGWGIYKIRVQNEWKRS